MTDTTQCDNCGAVLLKEDIFCGECGAPNPATDLPTAAEPPPPPSPPPAGPGSLFPAAPPDVKPSPSTGSGSRIAFWALVILGAVICAVGLAAFLLFGAIGGETTTPQEDWLYSTICCLLPIGGTGAILAAIGGIIWYARLRER